MNRVLKSILLLLVILMAWSCTAKTDGVPDVSVQGTKDKKTKSFPYRGGLMKFWVKLKEPLADAQQVRWKTGKADIAIRSTLVEEGLVIADTVYLHWESLPRATLVFDTIQSTNSSARAGSSSSATNSGNSMRVDTLVKYFDSVAVVVDGIESSLEIIEVTNILPKIDKMVVGGIEQPGDSTLTLSVHPGERMDVTLRFSDAFNLDYPVQDIIWPEEIGSFSIVSKADSAWVWSWSAPNLIVDTTLTLILTDKGGFGTREYRLQLIIYDEAGSAWVVSGEELVKYSPRGSEVARISGGYSEISDLVINPNTTIQNKVYVLDIGSNKLFQYDSYGRLIKTDVTTFDSPMSVAVDVESRLLWVADLSRISGDTLFSRIRRFNLNSLDSMTVMGEEFEVPGPVKGLSVDQFERDLVWFASPEEDFVGYVRSGSAQVRVFNDPAFRFNRPSMVSYDPVSGLAWIADSSRVIVIDTAGQIRATITGFEYANSLSAAGGVCWVSDILAGSVYRFLGSARDRLTTANGLEVPGFISPASVSTYAVDRGVWIADKGAGQVIRLDGNGDPIASGSGLTLPHLIRVHQVIE